LAWKRVIVAASIPTLSKWRWHDDAWDLTPHHPAG
jgi:hypothetical protein